MAFFRKKETTPGGSEVLRHGEVRRGEMTAAVTPWAGDIERWMDAAFPGRRTHVWHELVSEFFHLDVCVMEPLPAEPYYVLYTSGMSALPMTLDNLPHGGKKYDYLRRAELLCYLPAGWPVAAAGTSADADEAAYWPVRMLKTLARLPARCGTWLGAGHSVPNGDPMRPFKGAEGFAGAVLYLPDEGNGPRRVLPVQCADGTQIMLYVAVPVYEGEMNYKLAAGADALEERLRALPGGAGFIVTNGRPDVSKGEL